MWVLLFLGYFHFRHVYIFSFVSVPVFGMDGVGVMRMGEGYSEAEGPIMFGAPSGGVEVSRRFEHDFFVVIELVGADAGACLED